MAITDNTKKKPVEDGIGAGYGIPGGITAPAPAPKVMHSAVQPGLAQPAASTPVTAFGAGAATRNAIGSAVDAAGNSLVRNTAALVAPAAKALAAGTNFTAGLAGAQPGAPAAPVPAVSPIASAQAADRPVAAPVVQPPTALPSPAPTVQPPTPVPAASPVVGQFNGRDITRDDANAIAGRVSVAAPGAAPVVGPNGSVAFAPPGSLAGAAAASGPAQTPLEVPRFTPPTVDTRRVAAAEKERAALVGQLNAQISDMASSPSGLNSRGERQLYAELIGQRAGLTQQAGDLAGRAAGDQIGADTTAGVAEVGQAGENARALLREIGDNARTQFTEAGATARNTATLNKPEYATDANGNVVQTQGTKFTPVTGADGSMLTAPRTKAEGAITPQVQIETLVKQLTAEQGSLQPDPARIAEFNQKIAALMPSAQAQGAPKPTLEQFMAAARKANPGAADADLTAFYNQKYGQ
jgi:hypothetical protein